MINKFAAQCAHHACKMTVEVGEGEIHKPHGSYAWVTVHETCSADGAGVPWAPAPREPKARKPRAPRAPKLPGQWTEKRYYEIEMGQQPPQDRDFEYSTDPATGQLRLARIVRSSVVRRQMDNPEEGGWGWNDIETVAFVWASPAEIVWSPILDALAKVG